MCVRETERQRGPRERITMAVLRRSDWHHIQTERGGTEWWGEKKIGRVIKGMKGRGRQRNKEKKKKEKGRETERRVGAEETLEKTACKYANGGPLKWR